MRLSHSVILVCLVLLKLYFDMDDGWEKLTLKGSYQFDHWMSIWNWMRKKVFLTISRFLALQNTIFPEERQIIQKLKERGCNKCFKMTLFFKLTIRNMVLTLSIPRAPKGAWNRGTARYQC